MSTIIRDINGNSTTHTIRHFLHHGEPGNWHIDSTGLWCIDYAAANRDYCAFIRPETASERNACRLAERLGTKRE